MKRTRRKFTAKFKTQVVLEAIKERQTLSELAERFKLHPNQVTTWKKEFLNNAEEAFAKKSSKKDTTEKEIEELYQKIGRLEIDRKSTRLNSSHVAISYAVFCLKKKKKQERDIKN